MIQDGANPNSKSHMLETALMVAVSSKSNDAVDVLLEYGADVNLKNDQGQSALDMCQEDSMLLKLTQIASKKKVQNQGLVEDDYQNERDAALLRAGNVSNNT